MKTMRIDSEPVAADAGLSLRKIKQLQWQLDQRVVLLPYPIEETEPEPPPLDPSPEPALKPLAPGDWEQLELVAPAGVHPL